MCDACIVKNKIVAEWRVLCYYNLKMKTSEQDIKLARECINGSPTAWNEFVERFSGLVMWSIKDRLSKSGYRFTNNDSEDILQEVFLSIYKENKLARIKNLSKIAPWIVVLSGNIAINKIIQIKGGLISGHIIEDSALTLSDILEDKTPSALEKIEQNEQENIISEIINSLKPREKIIINLYYNNTNTINEIAGLLNMHQGSVASIITRARKKIKKYMHKNRISTCHI